MRLVATEYLSLDGVFEEPGKWSGPWFNDEAGRFKWDELQASDAQLLGRKTYEGFASAWPTMEGTGEFGEKMNTMPKYVVSTTLDKAEWPGSKLIKSNVMDEIRKLKEQPGKDLLLAGSGQLFNALLKEKPDRPVPVHGAPRDPRPRHAAVRRWRRSEAARPEGDEAVCFRHRDPGARTGSGID